MQDMVNELFGQAHWVILSYFPHYSTRVYGLFKSEAEAVAYAESHGLADDDSTFDVIEITEAK